MNSEPVTAESLAARFEPGGPLSLLGELHGQRENRPPVTLQKENARHRIILLMKSKGLSNKAIAEALEMSPVGVGIVCRQEWFKKALVQLLNDSGVDATKELIAGAATDAVYKIIDLMHTAKSEVVQQSSAFGLLHQFLGKPNQPMSSDKPTIADERALDAKIAALQKKVGNN